VEYGVRRWNRRFGMERSVKSICAVSIDQVCIHAFTHSVLPESGDSVTAKNSCATCSRVGSGAYSQ